MTKQEHIERHKKLHQYFDELLADFILHNERSSYLTIPIQELIEWSYQQTLNPTNKELEKEK